MKKIFLSLLLLSLAATFSVEASDYIKWGNLSKGTIESTSIYYISPKKYEIISQSSSVNRESHNKTVFFTANIKAKITSPKGWAGLWISLENNKGETIGLSNMINTPIKGTSGTWRKYTKKLYVPRQATHITYGVLLSGNGKVEISQGNLIYK